MANLQREQETVCERFGTPYVPPAPATKLGIALQTLGRSPLKALRHPAAGDACGWYVWAGDDLSEDAEFFQPLHVEHLPDRCPQLLPYLALPPGWRVQLAPGMWKSGAMLHYSMSNLAVDQTAVPSLAAATDWEGCKKELGHQMRMR